MDLYCTNTVRGLVPNYDADFEEKKKLRIGQVYKVKVTKARNYEFHQKYFALINCAWEYQNEGVQEFFKNNINLFRKAVEVASGHCEQEYSITKNEWVEKSKSISFDKMDELEFQQLYDNVKVVLFSVFLKNISEDEFMKNLVNF